MDLIFRGNNGNLNRHPLITEKLGGRTTLFTRKKGG